MKRFDPHITCAFLYTITRHGYPPAASGMVKYIEEMASLGFTYIELEGIGEEHLGQVNALRGEIRGAIDGYGLSLPVFCTVLPGLGSADSRTRENSLSLFARGCELAAYLGAAGVLDNGPLVPYRFPADMPILRHYSYETLRQVGFASGFDWKNYADGLAVTLRKACDTAASFGLSYYLHPCSGSLTETTDSFLLLRERVERENLKFNFDTSNQFFVRENLPLGLLKMAGALDYIHISDNPGDRPGHLAGGDGAIDWDTFFQTLKQTGFSGQLSIDVGGAESGIDDLDKAYTGTAVWLEDKIRQYGLFE